MNIEALITLQSNELRVQHFRENFRNLCFSYTGFTFEENGSLHFECKKNGSGEAALLAGGHSLIPAMKLRLSGPKTLIDISHIRELNKISVKNRMVHIGANVTHRAVENSKLVKKNCLVLSEAAGKIGDPQVRNRGTIGGSLAHADPAADYPALVLALGAEICVERKRSCREISADDFFTGLFETALKDGEMISKVSFPVLKTVWKTTPFGIQKTSLSLLALIFASWKLILIQVKSKYCVMSPLTMLAM